MNTILNQIEETRQEMMELANRYGMRDSRVLDKSCELDELLNKYEKIKKRIACFKAREMSYNLVKGVFGQKVCEG
ncbi:aspartyl-phosphate phosphatase Spo0E family protein [Gorillibacterium timonense]|uniref:aspartyl-phosphate phosphatase Spo0E family protein n=1 Tax=Gorillibacterium timonense TaxID=1689269 RepID=UPI00071D8D97|nr:aspartyl-phosphate phosphatase Spo0E family protein [Gorillibacterium timonense]